MKILVIGGGGFLGRKILERLAMTENQLYALVLREPLSPVPNCEYILVADYPHDHGFTELTFDVIVNVAMKRSTRVNPLSDDELNISNYRTPLAVIRRKSTKDTLVINTSTYIQNYEGKIGNTVEKYGASKELLSKSLRFDAELGQYKVVDLFLFTLYGPGDRENHLVPLLLSSIDQRARLQLSEGNQLINLLYVDDAVDNIVNALSISAHGYNPYCLWNDDYVTVKQLVSTIEDVFKVEMKIEWGAKDYAGHEMFTLWARPFDPIPNMLSRTPLAEGLRRTYESRSKAVSESEV
jgi:nucleoside-diphosphate-sugar epimerase